MNHNIEQLLKADGKAITTRAEARLQQNNFSQAIEQKLKQQTKKPQVWWYGMAAAISLSVISWLVFQHQKQIPEPVDPIEIVSQPSIPLNLQQIPLTIEHKVNQPLIQEQQAIIKDLKNLRKSILSI